jgi:hypothetical protein
VTELRFSLLATIPTVALCLIYGWPFFALLAADLVLVGIATANRYRQGHP